MYNYLALGDSYTIGEGVESAANYPHQLQHILNSKGMALSDPLIIATTGWTTDELQTAIREHRLQESFSFVTLLIGVNNQYRGRSLENYKEEFSQLLNQAIIFANGHSRHVLVLSIPDWGVTPFAEGRDRQEIHQQIDAYNHAAKELVLTHLCHWLDITESTRKNGKNPEFLVADGLHPSGKEYQIWAELMAPIASHALRS